jgi:hypothetical protein
MRLRADIFVSALLRRCGVDNVPAILRRRGAAEAGAIFIKVDRLDGTATLYGPAPQSEEMPDGVDRLFARLHKADAIDTPDAEDRLRKEIAFDSDLWIVEIDDRAGRPFVDLAEEAG